ncbi:hypothetical protein E3P92_01649 [Wallemia ichthyophaga]|nr:hypothetical protein E3P92_01649 [Wallemia ichthyophaga]
MKPSLLPLDAGPSAVLEKRLLESRNKSKYFTTYVFRIPFSHRSIPILIPRVFELLVDDSPPQHISTRSRRSERTFHSKLKLLFLLVVVAFAATFIFISFLQKVAQDHQIELPSPFQAATTLQFTNDELKSFWLAEIDAGRYPSSRKLPDSLQFDDYIKNPALPTFEYLAPIVQSQILSYSDTSTSTSPYPLNNSVIPMGPNRYYYHRDSRGSAYPPRPIPYSALDLDVVMEHCDFSTHQYVRDCLEVLAVGAGLDVGNHIHRGKLNNWLHHFTTSNPPQQNLSSLPQMNQDKQSDSCDPENPRIFHMFWAGPFTDKPYLALLSFLYTQNLGLHVKKGTEQSQPEACKPQFWVWINPGPASSIPNSNAVTNMFESLTANPWSSPFLHDRFNKSIKFKMWNTTEQLDGVPELAPYWRNHELFNSGGVRYGSPKKQENQSQPKKNEQVDEQRKNREAEEDDAAQAAAEKVENNKNTPNAPVGGLDEEDGTMENRVGSTSDSNYDRITVVLSDMARFILTHRFGGIYIDADTLFLRDWEELWGWSGAFAYRWSRLESYNTAVYKMHKNSQLGSFLFKTALANGFDFHPMTISKYTREAQLDNLLLRLPDALFDSAWLNTENFQMDRPPFPFLKEFKHLFETPPLDSSAPSAGGFESFYRGAFSYHFHNHWWLPFDPSRNFPDLGTRFSAGEDIARSELRKGAGAAPVNPGPKKPSKQDDLQHAFAGDKDRTIEMEESQTSEEHDLSWSTIIKRTFEAYIRGERPNMYGEYIAYNRYLQSIMVLSSLNETDGPSQASQMLLVSQAIVSELVHAQEKGLSVNLNDVRVKQCKKLRVTGMPKLVDIISAIPDEHKKTLLPMLKARPIRSASGIAVVALMCKPHRCPHIAMTGNVCVYCPGGPDSDFEYSTQSYTGYEPTSMRAIRARYDPYEQSRGRVEQLKMLGHSVDKVEYIIMGGTFMSMPEDYRNKFVAQMHNALSGYTGTDIDEAVSYSERANTKCVGITIETRPDYCLKPHLSQMLRYGCTRLEIGVQSVYEDVARDTNRGHTVRAVSESFHLAKDAGYKVVAHMMPDLPNVGVERDLEQFKEYFENPAFRSDGLKIYPTLVIRGTGLYELWRTGKYKNYTPNALVDIVARILALVPPWTRVYRVQRDIPMPLVSSGVENGNLREMALARMKDFGTECRDVRYREVGIHEIHHKVRPSEVELIRRDYTANGGWETFLSYEDPEKDILVGLLRLRKCSEEGTFRKELVDTDEKTGQKRYASMVRELHVYGTAIPVHGRDPTKFQHQGFGTLLMEEAARIAKEEHGSHRLAVISGVGTRDYYRRLGYKLDATAKRKSRENAMSGNQDQIEIKTLETERRSSPPPAPAPQSHKPKLSPYVIIPIWIALSSSVILYNKAILDSFHFEYPVFLVTYHLTISTIGTRVLAKFTNLLPDLKDVNMTKEIWVKKILPIGVFFSGSLIFSNTAYMYLSVSFIQMLKAFTPVAILVVSSAFGLSAMDKKTFGIVSMISSGVCIASFGEAAWNTTGFAVQVIAILLEASRLVMIQLILTNLKMSPLTSMYFFAPVCAVINACILPFTEGWAPFVHLKDLGAIVLATNASVAFGLNVAAVFLIGAASSLVLTLAGIGKDLLLIAGSAIIFGGYPTVLQLFGYSIALGGLVLFKTQGQGNFNVNNTSNTPPSKRQKISDSDRSHHKPGSITLQLKPLSLRSPSKSHESNCYRSITNFIGCLIDNNLPNHLKVETLQSNVRDLMRIYLKSSDLYGFILREVRRGLAALKPQSFNQDEHSGLFIRSISEIYSKSESWMKVIRYVFADLDRCYASKTSGVQPFQVQIEHLFREIILNDSHIYKWLFIDLNNCLVKVRQSLSFLTNIHHPEGSIEKAINTSNQLNELVQVHNLYQLAKSLDWELPAIANVYLQTMDDVIEKVCGVAVDQSLKVNDVVNKIYLHNSFEDAVSWRIDEHFNWDNRNHMARKYLSLTFDGIVKAGVEELIPYSWNNSSNRSTIEYNEIPSITTPKISLTRELNEIIRHTPYKEDFDLLLLERINIVIKMFVSNEENDHHVFDIPITSSYSQYKESFSKGLQFRANKPAEMIAKFLDSLLKDKRGQGENMEKVVDGAVELFRIVKDKDMFSAFYTLSLARRLVKNTSASNDNERDLISRITKVAGSDFTQNWEEMMKDIEISDEISNKFRDAHQTKLQRATIVQAARWPFKGQHLSLRVKDMADKDASEVAKQAHISQGDVTIPQWMTEELVEFTQYYQGVHANRCLTWNHSLAEVSLNGEFESNGGERSEKEIIMPLPASLILMVFNDKDEGEKVSYDELAQSTGLPEGELKRMLQSLSFGKVKLLQRFKKKDSWAGKEIKSSDSFAVVKVLEHPRKRFRLPIITAEVDVEESKETTAEVESARVFALQASAVRVLKARKKINVNELIHEVIADIEKRLTLKNEMGLAKQIKQTIEGLIEKDYAERIEGQRNMLHVMSCKKVVVIKQFDEGTKERPYGHCLVAGVERYPLKVHKQMGAKLIERRSKVKPFIKSINYNHLMPTRYALELEGLKGVVSPETFKEPTQREDAKKQIKKLFEERYHSGKNRWFFHALRLHRKQDETSSTSSSSPTATSTTATTTSIQSGTTGTGGTFTHIPNSSDIPLSSILPGMNLSGKTMSMPTTASPGQIPFSHAPPLPSSTPVQAEYPEMDKIPPVDHPQVQEWISQIDWDKVPDWSVNEGEASCSENPDSRDEAGPDQRCWWTCGSCTADDDITQCPNKHDWGLSYDDGPSPYTTTLLNYLAEQEITSTFFIVGSRALSRPDMLRAELVLGHQLSVHTWSHPHLTTLSNEELVAELGWTKKVIHEVTGLTPNTMRPPYGDIDNRVREVCRQMNLTPIIWTTAQVDGQELTFDTNDWKIASGDVTTNKSYETFEKILDSSDEMDHGFIVLQHDLYQQAVELAVAYVLPDALQRQPELNLLSVIDCLQKPQTEAYIETSSNETAPSEVGAGGSSASKVFISITKLSIAVAITTLFLC